MALAQLLSSLLLALIGGACLALAAAAWRRRPTPGAAALAGMNAAIAVWCLAYAVQLLLPGLEAKFATTLVVYIGVVGTPVAWLFFAARYAQRDGWLDRRRTLLFGIVPSLTLLLALTNGLHGLQWRAVTLVDERGVSTLAMRYGPWFLVHAAFSYALLLAGTVILLHALLRSGDLHRRQSAALLIAVTAPWVANVLHLLRLSPLYPLDITPFAFGLSAVCFSLALLRLHMLDVLPVAYGSVLAAIDDAVVVIDAAGRTVTVNPAAQRLLGTDGAWAVGRPGREVLAALPAVAAAAEGSAPLEQELSQEIDGAPRRLTVTALPLAGARGRLAGRLVLLRDVTQYRQAIERRQFLAEAGAMLAESLEYEQTLATLTRLVVPALADICLVHLVEDDGSLRLAALAAADPKRGSLLEEFERRYPLPPGAAFGYQHAIRSGQPFLLRTIGAAELAALAHDDEQRRLLDSIGLHSILSVPLLTHNRTLGALTFADTGSGRRYGPDELELAADLARRAAQALEHARLVADLRASEARASAANEAAEAANRAKAAFLAHTSHEIRTPLTAVLGLARLLHDTELSDWQRQIVAMLGSSSNGLMTVVNAVLDLSRIEAGRAELELAAVDLTACVEEALDLVAMQAEEQGLELFYAVAPGTPPVVTSNYVYLRQILVNLVSNAIKFTPAGSIFVEVDGATAPQEGAPRSVHFAVHDTGVGIAPARQPELFQSFNQPAPTPDPRAAGTGLGLAISKRLCELLGGTIGVTSEAGQGAIFHFSITAEAVPEQAPATPLDAQPALKGRRVLLVAPPGRARNTLAAQLAAWGMGPVVVIAEGTRALGADAPFELVIVAGTDAALPAKLPGDPPRIALLPFRAGATGVRQAYADSLVLSLPLKYSRLYAMLHQLFEAPRRASSPRPQSTPAGPAPLPLRILVAEDSEVNRLVVLHLLARQGQTAENVPDGPAALAALRARPYDVALLDLQLPGMSGLDVAARIASEHAPAERPYLVALTAYTTAEQRRLSLQQGMDDYADKPVSEEELAALLGRARIWLQTHHGRAAEPPADLASLRATLDEDDVVERLVETYLATAPELLIALRDALERDDAAGMARALHRLRSSSAAVTARRLADLCAELEALIDADQRDLWPARVRSLAQEYAQVAEALTVKDEG